MRQGILVLAFSLAILLLIPVWAGFGFFEVAEEEGHPEGGMMMGMDIEAKINEFLSKARAFAAKYGREDGCVEPRLEQEEEHIVVYVAASRFAFLPPKLCLKAGVPYQFRVMAIDVMHGFSIQLKDGSVMARLTPGMEFVREITFNEPGKYLLYCSFYCGIGHPTMRGEIIVEPEGEHEHG